MKKTMLASAGAAIALAGSTVMATPASAQPLVTGGLVNVTVSNIDVTTGDILSNNTVVATVGAALGVAANVCDVNVNVLATQLRNGGAVCTADADNQQVTQQVTITPAA